MIRCKSCRKLIGIEVEIERRTYGYSQTKYENVIGVYTTPSGRKKLEVDESSWEWVEPEITYQCDFCGCEYTEEQVIQLMEELAELDKGE